MVKWTVLKFICCTLLPIISIFGVLALSWVIAAFTEIYTNNLTMLRVFDQFTKQDNKINGYHFGQPYPDDKKNNIFWFVQITDIHISKFRSYGQVEDLKRFCTTTLSNINPDLVLATGDLTDAKDVSNIGSSQYEVEWQTYTSVLKKCNKFKWLDLRGNHDTFAVPHKNSSENFFDKYAVSKTKFDDSGVYQYIHSKKFGQYSFTGVDFTPEPGPGRPFNFYGVPSKSTLNKLKKLSEETNKFNATVWYGHYPLSTTTSPHALRKLLSSGIVYLCGHLHTLLGFFPTMHAVHNSGFLELELGDWKENRRYRVGVFDHDMFSFTDANYFTSDPVIVFTNPTDARYMVPGETSYLKAGLSSHIRFLVFHDKKIKEVRVYVDNQLLCSIISSQQQLYTCKWNTEMYADNLHLLAVHVEDVYGKKKNSTIQFSLDGTRPPLNFLSIILLLTDFCTMARMVFVVSVLTMILFPLLLKKWTSNEHIGLVRSLLRLFAPQFMRFLDCDEIFWPLFYYSCYLCIGPLSIGFFVPDQLGVLFSFGIYSGGHHITGSLTYLYVGGQLLLFNSIMMFYLGEILCPSTNISIRELFTRNSTNKVRTLLIQSLFTFLLWNQVMSTRMFWIAYGQISCLVNVVKTWTIPLAFYLVKKAYIIKSRLRKLEDRKRNYATQWAFDVGSTLVLMLD